MANQNKPIQLYYWPTPNCWKASIMLEELSVPFNVNYVNIAKGDQFAPEFLEISPNNRVPAIVDPEGPDSQPITVFESGAILLYLARKFNRFYPKEEKKRVVVDEWLMWQMGGLGPMSGQAGHFRNYAAVSVPYGIERYTDEVNRLYGVMNKRLQHNDYLAGNYSIADMACIGWVSNYTSYGQTLEDFPHLYRWFKAVRERPAVQKGLDLGKDVKVDLAKDKDAQSVLFNQKARH